MLQKKTILVTGGAGYIGSHMCKLLAKEGWLPVTFDNLSTGSKACVRFGPFFEGDLLDSAAIMECMRQFAPIAVMHFAASALVGESMRDPGKYYRNNVAGTISLLNAMLHFDVKKLIFSSTCAIYGTPSVMPISEEHPRLPINPYGVSKEMIERMLQDYEKAYGIKSVALRYFNAAGADLDGELGEDRQEETHLIPLLLQAALGKQEISIFGTDYLTPDGTAIRDYVHVEDLTCAHLKALHWLLEGGRSCAFNLGTGRGYSVAEVIKAAEEVVGSPICCKKEARRAGDPAILIADPTKARAELGWRSTRSDLLELLRSTWNWYKNKQ